MSTQKNNYVYLLTGFLLTLSFPSTTFADSGYWRKAIECSTVAAGTAYIDIDQSNVRRVQIVIKNSAAIQYLYSAPIYSNPAFQVLAKETAVLQGETLNPNFSPRDFQTVEHPGTFGSGYGWYYGNRIFLHNGSLVYQVIQNAYEKCSGFVDSEGMCRGGEVQFYPEKIVKDWIFPNCHTVY